MKRFSFFEIIVLVSWLTTFLFGLLNRAVFFLSKKSSDKSTVNYVSNIKQQTEKVSNSLINRLEHLAAQEPDAKSW